MIPVPFSESAYSSQSDGASSPLPGLGSEWSTFQEKRCGPWPLEDSRELLLERMLLTEGQQVTKVTSSVLSTRGGRGALPLSREDMPVRTPAPRLHSVGFTFREF